MLDFRMLVISSLTVFNKAKACVYSSADYHWVFISENRLG